MPCEASCLAALFYRFKRLYNKNTIEALSFFNLNHHDIKSADVTLITHSQGAGIEGKAEYTLPYSFQAFITFLLCSMKSAF